MHGASTVRQNGFDLLISQHEQSAENTAQELEQMGANVQIAQADLATSDGVDALYRAIQAMGIPSKPLRLRRV